MADGMKDRSSTFEILTSTLLGVDVFHMRTNRCDLWPFSIFWFLVEICITTYKLLQQNMSSSMCTVRLLADSAPR
jgi:hypothetical protein